MSSILINQLNKEFSFSGIDTGTGTDTDNSLRFVPGKGDIPIVEIQNKFATSKISLQGAHLLSWVPKGHDEVIWLSSEARFIQGKSIRGGIPICWPWFGAHKENPSFPAHGFARTVCWKVIKTEKMNNGETRIVFSLDTSELPKTLQTMWPNKTTVNYSLCIGKQLRLELNTFNKSEEGITIGQALHTYFNVQDITGTKVSGLENKTYLDKPDNFKAKKQIGPISINAEVDRVYLGTIDDVVIDTETRRMIINKEGSHSTVVWNPWREVAAEMGDLGEDGYLKMLCVESANAADDSVSIEAGESHKLAVTYRVKLND